jgi:hypothetical protein
MVGLVIASVALVAKWLLPMLAYATGDSIVRADLDTQRRLARYERTGNPEEVRPWLIAYHGEAPSHQVMVTLGHWSLRHQRQFLDLVDGLDEGQKPAFAKLFAFALFDSGRKAAFVNAFTGYLSPELTAILHALRRGMWPEHHRL